MTLAPRLEGFAPIRSPASEFLLAFRRRVEAGLLSGIPHPRSNYRISHASTGHLHVRAAGWWTAINVGLNELDLEVATKGRVSYQIRFWRWAVYCIGLGAALAAIFIGLFSVLDLRAYIEERSVRIPGLSIDHHVLLAWAMVIFWGFVWPWLLIALHKRPLRRLVERLIAEVDEHGGSSTAP
jgi:hypothetical protein